MLFARTAGWCTREIANF